MEMRAAQDKHGDQYVENLTMRSSIDLHLVHSMVSAGAMARSMCDEGYPTQLAVLMEEVGEVVEAVLAGSDPTEELIQVAAMAAAMAQKQMGEVDEG